MRIVKASSDDTHRFGWPYDRDVIVLRVYAMQMLSGYLGRENRDCQPARRDVDRFHTFRLACFKLRPEHSTSGIDFLPSQGPDAAARSDYLRASG